jgi:glucokinase
MVESIDQADKLIGIEASVSALRAVCLNGEGSVTAAYAVDLNRREPTLPQFAGFVTDLKQHFGDFSRVGVAVPGLVGRGASRIEYSAHFPEHTGIDLADRLRAETGLEAVIENDANAAAYGEYKLGAGRGSSSMFYATLGEGIGGAFILNGEIWRGAAGFAGEFGYVAINSEGLRLEDVASAENIVRRTRNRFNRDSTSSLNKIPEEAIRIEEIVAAAEAGDDFARLMLERTGNYIGSAIANVINLFNVETIVLGGDIMHAGHIVLSAVNERAKYLSFDPSFESCRILEGELGDNAAAAGAALIASKS